MRTRYQLWGWCTRPRRRILRYQHLEYPTGTRLEAATTVMDQLRLFDQIVASLHVAIFDESLWLPTSALIDGTLCGSLSLRE